MRTRSKSEPFVAATSFMEAEVGNYTNPAGVDFINYIPHSTVGLSYPRVESTISDVKAYKPEVYVDPLTKRWKRVKRSSVKTEISHENGLPYSLILRPKPCVHVSRVLALPGKTIVAHQRVNSAGNPLFERTDTRTYNFEDGLQMLNEIGPGSIEYILDGDHGSPPKYWGHDWFALMSRFHEACDQYIPSSTLIGESMIEYGVFKDALLLVLNPTRAISNLLRDGLKLGRKVRKMSLGRACLQIAKSSADADLYYQFGVKPAISDISDALDAHSKVSSRLQYLRSAAGRFVPVRVRQDLMSDFDGSIPEVSSNPNDSTRWQWVTTNMVSSATIGCWGRVRDDIRFRGDWAAYLQYFGINKVIGLAWELIPFSFVVDWFTNAQERINSMTRLQTGGPFTEFCNFCTSVKKRKVDELFLVPGYDLSFSGNMIEPSSVTSVAKITTVDYRRSLSIPDTSGLLDFSSLGLFHGITGAGLIIQRL